MVRDATGADPRSAGAAGEKEVVLIDFGLGSLHASVEDKAVDLYVLERAFLSTHPDAGPLFAEVLRAYEAESPPKEWRATAQRLEAVRARGRKRTCFG
jgi:TP53 regulating kinase-like protein